MSRTAAQIDFEVVAQPTSCRTVRERATGLARAHGIDEDDLAQFLTALGEAVANAIEHARSERPIQVGVRLNEDRITATVRDCGVGFAGDRVPEELPCGDAERGRGLPIMRRCSDIFALESSPGEGTVIVIGRFLRRGRVASVA